MVKKLKFSFIKILKNLLKAKRVIGIVREGEFYISNIAVYPEFRGMGLGT
ncbi:MAG: GNAT family N-acetyltransferase, partial [Caldiserica bacterium]|nr:GNAT family N-acetyltransferase [Caldisericota bacterium]